MILEKYPLLFEKVLLQTNSKEIKYYGENESEVVYIKENNQ